MLDRSSMSSIILQSFSLTCMGAQAYDLRMAKRKNKAAQALGKLGGLKGGKARAKALSPERRSEIARKAADARWDKEKAQERRLEV
jgi:hypothetical protein